MSNPPTWSLNATCDILTNADLSPQQAFAQAYFYQLDHPDGQTQTQAPLECIDYTLNGLLSSFKDQSSSNSGRSWQWQTCNEFGWYQSSYYPGTSIFPTVDAQMQVNWCPMIYGLNNNYNITANIRWTLDYYGGDNLEGSNILFTNGLLDPWHTVSINEDTPNGVKAVTYEAGHCGTMIAPSSEDPPSLTQARETVQSFLASILKDR